MSDLEEFRKSYGGSDLEQFRESHKNNPEEQPSLASDLAYQATSAANAGFAGLARTADTIFSDGEDGEFIKRLDANVEYGNDQLSDAQKESNQKTLLSDKEGEFFGEGITDPRKISGLIASGAGSLVPTLTTGGPLASLGKNAAIKLGANATGKVAAGASAVGYGLSEAGMVGGGVSGDIQKGINDMPQEVMDESPVYRDLIDNQKLNDVDARGFMGRELGVEGMIDSVPLSVLFGTVGGHFMSKALAGKLAGSRLKNAASGVLAEAPTEAGQGASEQYVKNIQLAKVDPTINPMEGVAEAGLGEGIGGAGIGGVMGAVSSPHEKPQEKPPGPLSRASSKNNNKINQWETPQSKDTKFNDIRRNTFSEPSYAVRPKEGLTGDDKKTFAGFEADLNAPFNRRAYDLLQATKHSDPGNYPAMEESLKNGDITPENIAEFEQDISDSKGSVPLSEYYSSKKPAELINKKPKREYKPRPEQLTEELETVKSLISDPKLKKILDNDIKFIKQGKNFEALSTRLQNPKDRITKRLTPELFNKVNSALQEQREQVIAYEQSIRGNTATTEPSTSTTEQRGDTASAGTGFTVADSNQGDRENPDKHAATQSGTASPNRVAERQLATHEDETGEQYTSLGNGDYQDVNGEVWAFDDNELTAINNVQDNVSSITEKPIEIDNNQSNTIAQSESLTTNSNEGQLKNEQKNQKSQEAPVEAEPGETELSENKVDTAAKDAAHSPDNNLPEPSDAQKEAGNYKLGHTKVNGLDISIENPKGSIRSGKDDDGKVWSNEIKSHYGYFKGTIGKDKDHVDVFIGDSAETSDNVFIVDQINPKTGEFDEHKVMMGYADKQSASDAYNENYDKNWKGLSNITEMPIGAFKTWVKDKKKTAKRADESKPSQETLNNETVPTATQENRATDEATNTAGVGSTEADSNKRAEVPGSSQEKAIGDNDTYWKSIGTNNKGEKLEEGRNGKRRLITSSGRVSMERNVSNRDNNDRFQVSEEKEVAKADSVERDPDKSIGKNSDGFDVYEDERGVRSYVERGIKVSESVSLTPNRGNGISINTESRGDSYKTTDELGPVKEKPAKTAKIENNEQFAGNKIFTADKVAEARARLKSKLGTSRSGFDPELAMDGLIIAGAYVESGVREFGQFSKAVIADIGEGAKPYLRSWYEAARHYPDLDNKGMSEPDAIELMTRYDVFAGDKFEYQGEQLEVSYVSGNSIGFKDGKKQQHGLNNVANFIKNAKKISVEIKKDPSITEDKSPERNNEGTGNEELQQGQSIHTNEGSAKGNKSTTISPTDSEKGDRGVSGRKSGERSTANESNDGAGLSGDGSVRGSKRSSSSFQITEEIAKGGAKTKFKANIKAIIETRKSGYPDQSVLVQYVGWGGLAQAFYKPNGSVTKGWEKEAAELKLLLSDEEYEAARSSTRNAHYTPKEIIDGIWSAVEKFGYAGGTILEPSLGTGNFLGFMPTKFKSNSQVHGIELDPITSKIAKGLYPDAHITNTGFEKHTLQDESFTLAIGNPPFGQTKIFDKDRKHLKGMSIHNFFFAKSIDALKPKGVLAMVVSTGFMDAGNQKAREYIGSKAKLLGAIRLPNNAFLKNAGTQVTTDIIFLQKLEEGETGNVSEWLGTSEINDTPINQYFVNNPNNLLGYWGKHGSQYRPDQPALVASKGQNTDALLKEAIDKLPSNIMEADTEKLSTIDKINDAHSRLNSMFVEGDKLFTVVKSETGINERIEVKTKFDAKGIEKPLSVSEIKRIKSMVGVASAAVEIRELQLQDDVSNAALDKARAKLNATYDNQVKQFGFLNNATNKRLFESDVNSPFLLSLEKDYSAGISKPISIRTGDEIKPESATKADIFSKRTQSPYHAPTQADNPKDALTISLSEKGLVDMGYMQKLTGDTEEQLTKNLKGLVYDDPAKGWVTKEEYLSGNVKLKLKQTTDPENIEALKKVIPADIAAIDISVKPGSSWLPRRVVADFVRHITGSPTAEAVYAAHNAKWSLTSNPASSNRSLWGTSRSTITDILNAAINSKQIQVRDRINENQTKLNVEATNAANDKVEKIKSEWNEWVWQSEARREELSKIYNDTFNVYAKRQYDGSHLKFTGKVSDDIFKLRPHQTDGVWRVLQGGTVLFDHTVGTGKTATTIAAIMELKRTGKAKKPMVVVPNHLVQQWGKEFMELYPNANILVPTKQDFQAKKRKLLMARIATGEYDAVIIAHSQLTLIENDPVFERSFIKKQINTVQRSIDAMREAEGKGSRTVKQAESSKAALETRLEELNDMQRDDNLNMTELGIDAMFVDEAHEFKNLQYSTGLQRVAGLGNPKGSKKAFDLFIKTQGLLERTGGNNLTFLTGTPISNTLAEMFTMQRYLDHAGLERDNLQVFDAWVNQFADIVTDWELSPAGKYKLNTRLAKFNNIPELIASYNQFADVVTRDDIQALLRTMGKELPIPKVKGGKPQNIVVDRSQDQANYIGEAEKNEYGKEVYPQHSLIYRSEHLPKGKPKKGDDNMLKIMSDARKAALDMRLIDPAYPDNPDSKVNVAVGNILDIYHKFSDKKGAQLVFNDLSVPSGAIGKEKSRIEALLKKADEGDEKAAQEVDKLSPDELDALNGKFSVYDDMKAKLITKGMPEAEVAFIHDAKTDKQKQDLFAKVRSGRIRVLIGSTSKMGSGMNVQNKLVALHHMDAPWRPSDLEQREGRIIRQGNEFYGEPGFEVEINRYATKNTLDSRMWQTIEAKANFIEQLKNGNVSDRTVEDVAGEASNAAEMKAASSGNPLILEEMTVKSAIKKLEGLKKEHNRSKHRVSDTIKSNNKFLKEYDDSFLSYKKNADLAKNAPKEFLITVNGKTYTKRDKAGAAIMKVQGSMNNESYTTIGEYAGFKMSAIRTLIGDTKLRLSANGIDHELYFIPSEQSAAGLSQKITNKIKGIQDAIDKTTKEVKSIEEDTPKLEKQLGPFDKEQELAGLKVKREAILKELRQDDEQETEVTENINSLDNDLGEVNSVNIKRSTAKTKKSGSTVSQIKSLLPRRVIRLLDSGKLKVVPSVDDISDNAYSFSNDEGIEGFYDPGTDTLYLVADQLTEDNLNSTLNHELYHRARATDKKLQNNLTELDKRLQERFDLTAKGIGTKAEKDAYNRVMDANTPAKDQVEEFQAYIITAYNKNPESLSAAMRKWVKDLFATIRAALIRQGVLPKDITPQVLNALAMYGSKVSSSTKVISTRTNDNQVALASIKPAGNTTSSKFKQWFANSKMKRAGKPIRFYHGTNADFTVYDKSKLGDNTLHTTAGLGHFFTEDKEAANKYGDDTHEVYLSIQNPYVTTSDTLDKRMGDDANAFTEKLKKRGFDGIFIRDAGYAIAFESNQVKLTSNENPTSNPDVRFSRTSDIINDLSESELKEKIDTSIGRTASGAKAQAFGLLTLRQIAEQTRKVLPNIKKVFVKNIHAMDTEKNKRLSAAGEIATSWAKLDKKISNEMSDLMHDSTIAGVDGSAVDDNGNYVYVKSIDIDEAKQKINVINQKMRDRAGDSKAHWMREIKELRMMMAFEKKREISYPALKSRFIALATKSPEAARIYNESRDHHEKHFEDTLEALKKRIGESKASPDVKQNLIAKLRLKFESLQAQAPYFPLARFGDYWVHTAEGEETSFNMFESEIEQEQFIKQMQSDGIQVLGSGKQLENLSEIDGVSAEFISDVDSLISDLGDDPMVNDLRDSVYQLYLNSLPDVSARKHFIHRKKTKGFHQDQLRAFAKKALHDANNIAKLKFGHKLQSTLDESKEVIEIASSAVKRGKVETMLAWTREYLDSGIGLIEINERLSETDDEDEHAKLLQFKKWSKHFSDESVNELADYNANLLSLAGNIKPDDRVFAVNALNELRKSYKDIMNPKVHPLAQKLNSMGFAWYLGLTPAAALVNMTQTPVVSLPILASKVGWSKASSAMLGATKLFFKNVKSGKNNGIPWVDNLSIENELKGDELKAHKEWIDSGLLDVTLAHDLAGLSDEGILTNTGKHKLMNVLSFGFHHAERMNREITALASYRAAKQKGMTHTEAVQFAADLVLDSHFDYTSSNRARFMRGNVARVVTQFKQYSQNLTYLYANTIKEAYKGSTPEEQEEARKALKGMLVMQFAAAGTLGMPMAGVAMGIAQALNDVFGDDDDFEDIEGNYRQLLADIASSITGSEEAGNKFSMIMSKGLVDGLTPFSVAGRLSTSDLWIRGSNRELEGADQAWQWAKTIMGPMAGLLLENPAIAMSMMSDGHYERGLEYMMPKAIKDGMKAVRYSTQGVKNLRGDRIKDDYSIAEGVGQIMGFASSEISDIYDQNNAIKRVKAKRDDRRGSLLSKAANARIDGDNEAFNDARIEILKFNKANPDRKITASNIRQSIKGKGRRSKNTTNGLYLPKRNRDIADKYRFAS